MLVPLGRFSSIPTAERLDPSRTSWYRNHARHDITRMTPTSGEM